MKGTQSYKILLEYVLSNSQRFYVLGHLANDSKLNPHIVYKIILALAKENLVDYYFSKKIMIIDVQRILEADVNLLLTLDVHTSKEKELSSKDI